MTDSGDYIFIEIIASHCAAGVQYTTATTVITAAFTATAESVPTPSAATDTTTGAAHHASVV